LARTTCSPTLWPSSAPWMSSLARWIDKLFCPIQPSLKRERGVYTVGTTGGDDISFVVCIYKK
jgi:hypothetical protein